VTPEENSTLQEFLEALTSEERIVMEGLANDRLGISLRTAVNELDWYTYNFTRQSEPTSEQNEHFYLMGPGVARLVGIMLGAHAEFTVPTLMFRRQGGPYRQVLEILSRLGFIQHGRRLADTVRTGLGSVSRSDGGRFEFVLPARVRDEEAVERDVATHFRRETARLHQEQMATSEGRRLRTEVNALLKENVAVFREHFMGYDAHPLLDEYFFQMAWADLTGTAGYDSFNELREFGGIRFLKYLLAVAFVNSLCLKHEAFCAAMTKKHPSVRLEDILTITSDRAGFVASIRDALNLFGLDFQNYTRTSLDEAWRIYEVIAITRRNLALLDRVWPPLPCVIEFSSSGVIKFVSGRHRQMEFVLDSLRHSFPREYDSHQRLREESQQRGIETLLGEVFTGLEVRRNVNLRRDGKLLTDVDLAVIDRRFGDLLLIQLKFQDKPGPDPRAVASRMGRFREETVRWLAAVGGWLNSSDMRQVKSAFRVPREVSVTRIRKVIIGHHHAWPLQSVKLDDDTAYATWSQFLNVVMLMKLRQGDFRTLNGLFSQLRTHIVGATPRYHENEPPVEYVLDGLRFAIRHESDDPLINLPPA
jgi:hypothetical protein